MRLTALLIGLMLMSPSNLASLTPSDHQALADRIVQQMALQPGEKVLLLSHPGDFQPLVPLLRQAVIRAGGVDLGCWQVSPEAFAGLDPAAAVKSAKASRAALIPLLRSADLAVMLPGATPSDPEYAAMQDVLREGRGRTIHFHWSYGGAPSAYPVPGHPVPPQEVIDTTYVRAVLQSDCRAIGEVQRRFAAALRAGEVRVTTPAGTDLRFRIGDRPINFQDGDASAARTREARVLIDREIEIPCGAIRVAPLEETVEGTIAFPPGRWTDRNVEGLTLRFAKGRIVDVRARSGQDAVEAELKEGGEGTRAFRELALGFNPLLAVPESAPWIPYYGYGAGVIRLSLGDNSELGGKVTGGYVRWNLFTDATLTAGGQVWVRDGKLTVP
ncbi:MAG TPA: aminopeptidase [Thermoanaerobaculia bacterium]|nr:aminopeptidase [Thermoanaerobaculia bacterium]